MPTFRFIWMVLTWNPWTLKNCVILLESFLKNLFYLMGQSKAMYALAVTKLLMKISWKFAKRLIISILQNFPRSFTWKFAGKCLAFYTDASGWFENKNWWRRCTIVRRSETKNCNRKSSNQKSINPVTWWSNISTWYRIRRCGAKGVRRS